jgi:hypothetical protein
MYISKVDIAFKAVDGGELLGDKTVFVKTAKKNRKAVSEAALASLGAATVDFDQVDHQRLVTSIETISLDRNAVKDGTTSATLDEWGLKCEDLDEAVHETASAWASDANNGGLAGQIEFLGKMDLVLLVEEIVNALNCGN